MKYIAQYDDVSGELEIIEHDDSISVEDGEVIFTERTYNIQHAARMVMDQNFHFRDLWTRSAAEVKWTAPLKAVDPDSSQEVGMLVSGVPTEVANCMRMNIVHERHLWQGGHEHYTCNGDPSPIKSTEAELPPE